MNPEERIHRERRQEGTNSTWMGRGSDEGVDDHRELISDDPQCWGKSLLFFMLHGTWPASRRARHHPEKDLRVGKA